MTGAQPRVAFCGLGRMGVEMVTRLVECGVPVVLWNRTTAKADELAARLGIESTATPEAAAREADVVITMLTDGPAVLSTLVGEDGILAGAKPGSVMLDCSTTGAEAAREAADLCRGADVRFVDCPVSGSTTVALQGKLGLMAGGQPEVVAELTPLLEHLGTVVHVGPTGSGAAAKIAVNALLHSFSTALSECLVAAQASGVEPDRLFDVLQVGVLWNRFLDYKRLAFTDPSHAPVAFDLRTATKDLGLALRASTDAGLADSLVERAAALHQRAVADGYGERDMAAMAAWFADHRYPLNSPTSGDLSPHARLERN